MASSSSQSDSQTHHFFDYVRILSVRWPLVLTVFLLVSISTAVITFLMPKQYESTALIQVQENADFEIFQSKGPSTIDPRFTTTQFEIIRSKEILKPVIDKLGLAQKWAERYELKSPERVYIKLQKMLRLEELRNTNLISISVLSPDKEEAAEIANAVAKEYQEARIREQQSWVGKSLASLRDEVDKQRDKTEQQRAKAAEIRVKYQINDLNPESVEEALQAEDKVLLSVEEEVSGQRLKTASLRAQYDELAKLTDEELQRWGTHTERGRMTVAELACHMPDHDAKHMEQIRRILRAATGSELH